MKSENGFFADWVLAQSKSTMSIKNTFICEQPVPLEIFFSRLKKEKFLVLRDANLKIDAGQTMEIIGQNGSGKIKSLEFKAPTISALFKKNGNFFARQ